MEKENTLGVQCRRNGWTDVSGELEEYEKVLEEEIKAESKSFFALQYLNIYPRHFNVALGFTRL